MQLNLEIASENRANEKYLCVKEKILFTKRGNKVIIKSE